jgi:hypothetical protein
MASSGHGPFLFCMHIVTCLQMCCRHVGACVSIRGDIHRRRRRRLQEKHVAKRCVRLLMQQLLVQGLPCTWGACILAPWNSDATAERRRSCVMPLLLRCCIDYLPKKSILLTT